MANRAAIATSYIKLMPEMSGFFREFDRGATASVRTSGTKAGNGFGNAFGAAFRGVWKGLGIATLISGSIAAAVGGAVLKGGLSRALNIQDAQASLKGLGYEASQIKGITTDVLASVKGTAFALDEAMTIAGSALASGIPEGQGLTDYLKLIADTATITKSPLNEIGAIYNKVSAKGKAYTEELNQLTDKGLPIFAWLQKEYDVTAEGLSEMVEDGKVDAATFRKVIEENIGGAALAGGDTARGAWANVMSALGRLGAMFTSSGVNGAPALFTAMAGGVDRLATALTPFAEELSEKLGVFFARLTEYVEDIDFDAVVAKVANVVETVQGLLGNIAAGNWSAIASDFQDFMAGFSDIEVGDLGESFGGVFSAITPLIPLFNEVGAVIGAISGAVVDLATEAIPFIIEGLNGFRDALRWVADNSETIAPILVGLAVAVAAYRVAQVLANAAAVASIPLQYYQIASNFQLARANSALAAQMAIANGTQLVSNRSKLASLGIMLAQTGGMVAQRAVIIAGAVAMGIATAAQWAWNAAMTANPIGLIIVAIGALVAGIIWVATQTTFFQDAWKNTTKFIGESVVNIGKWFSDVGRNIMTFFGIIGKVITTIWRGIGNFVIGIVNGIIGAINFIIRAINSLKIPIPEWAKGLFGGAKNIGFNISTVAKVPALYQGADIGGTRDGTLVRVGDRNNKETVTDYGNTNKLIKNAVKVSTAALNNANTPTAEPIIQNFYITPTPGTDPYQTARQVAKVQRKTVRR